MALSEDECKYYEQFNYNTTTFVSHSKNLLGLCILVYALYFAMSHKQVTYIGGYMLTGGDITLLS